MRDCRWFVLLQFPGRGASTFRLVWENSTYRFRWTRSRAQQCLANISVNAPVYIVNMYRKSVQQLCACYTRDLTLERLFTARLLHKQALFRVVLVSLTKRDFVRKLQAGRVMA